MPSASWRMANIEKRRLPPKADGFRRRAIAGLQERGKMMAGNWWEGFWAEFVRELGLEWWFHRPGRQAGGQTAPAPGTTIAPQVHAPRKPQVPPSLILALSREERKAQAPRFRGKLGDIFAWPEEDQQKLAKLPQEEMREFFEVYYPTLKERWGKMKEAVGRLDDKIQASPETINKVNEHLDRWARWLGRRS